MHAQRIENEFITIPVKGNPGYTLNKVTGQCAGDIAVFLLLPRAMAIKIHLCIIEAAVH